MRPNQACSLAIAAVAACIILGLAVPASASSPSPGALAVGGESKPYVVFHLDAISSKVFFEMIDAGMLPNISALFSGGAYTIRRLAVHAGNRNGLPPTQARNSGEL